MPYYNSFCVFCSVRLGSIFVGIISFVFSLVKVILMIPEGSNWYSSAAKNIEAYIKENQLDESFLDYFRQMDKNKETYFIVVTTLYVCYMIACILDIIGAYIVNKWLLLPFIILELVRLIVFLALFCITLIIIKKAINLGLLISCSVLGTFIILIFGYLWACVVSLFQIIFVVNSSSYRALYGDNPLKKSSKNSLVTSNKSRRTAKIERVKFFPSPNFNKGTDKLKTSPKVDKYDKHDKHPFGVGQSQRIRNEYIEMRRTYLNQSDFGHGDYNTQF